MVQFLCLACFDDFYLKLKYDIGLCYAIFLEMINGLSGGAMVLGKLPVSGRPTNLDYSRARAYCACSRCGWGCLDIFLSSIISLFFLPLFGRQPDIHLNTVSKGR